MADDLGNPPERPEITQQQVAHVGVAVTVGLVIVLIEILLQGKGPDVVQDAGEHQFVLLFGRQADLRGDAGGDVGNPHLMADDDGVDPLHDLGKTEDHVGQENFQWLDDHGGALFLNASWPARSPQNVYKT